MFVINRAALRGSAFLVVLRGMNEEQVTVEENNNPADLETKVVDEVVINGQQVPDPDQVDPGVNSRTE